MATDTKLENNIVNPHEEKCAHENFYRKLLDYKKHLSTFGEMGVVRSTATVKAKLEGWGKMCMFLGYAQNDNGGTYHMLNLCTQHILLRHIVIWINIIYSEYASIK